ncbi:MAG: hypothetical protein JRH09_07105 [Deltaproteobacteria bacterium]|nr:hypothetical protein [Deltaproteobacteria bacterium]
MTLVLEEGIRWQHHPAQAKRLANPGNCGMVNGIVKRMEPCDMEAMLQEEFPGACDPKSP